MTVHPESCVLSVISDASGHRPAELWNSEEGDTTEESSEDWQAWTLALRRTRHSESCVLSVISGASGHRSDDTRVEKSDYGEAQ